MQEVFKQKVNFIISVLFIAAFGIFMTITVVHALNATVPIFNSASTPLDLGN